MQLSSLMRHFKISELSKFCQADLTFLNTNCLVPKDDWPSVRLSTFRSPQSYFHELPLTALHHQSRCCPNNTTDYFDQLVEDLKVRPSSMTVPQSVEFLLKRPQRADDIEVALNRVVILRNMLQKGLVQS